MFRAILDTFHSNNIEIVSPTFINQRRLADELKIIPIQTQQSSPGELSVAEEVVFDKAEQAEQIEKDKQQLLATIKKYKQDLELADQKDKKR